MHARNICLMWQHNGFKCFTIIQYMDDCLHHTNIKWIASEVFLKWIASYVLKLGNKQLNFIFLTLVNIYIPMYRNNSCGNDCLKSFTYTQHHELLFFCFVFSLHFLLVSEADIKQFSEILKPWIYNYSIIIFPILYAKSENLKTLIDSNLKKKKLSFIFQSRNQMYMPIS